MNDDKIKHYGVPLNESKMEALKAVTKVDEAKAALELAVDFTIAQYKRKEKKLKEFKDAKIDAI